MIRRPPRSTQGVSSAASDVYKRQFPGHRYDDEEMGQTTGSTDAQGYVRSLDLSNATANTQYVIDGVTYTRTVFTSFEDNVTVMRIEASEPGKLNFNVCFAAPNKTNMEKLDVNKITSDGMIEASLIPARDQSENVANKLNCYTFITVSYTHLTLPTILLV